jgi:hypothetical protein
LSIALLNWAFAFTIDDFFMAASYRLERKVQPPGFDAGLMRIWSTITFTLACIVLFQQSAWWQACIILASVVFILALPNLFDFGRTMILIFDSWGIIPPPVEEWILEDSGKASQVSATADPGHSGTELRRRSAWAIEHSDTDQASDTKPSPDQY